MPNKRKFKMLSGVACLVGFVLGLFRGLDDKIGQTSEECRRLALLGFFFFIGSLCFISMIEKGITRLIAAIGSRINSDGS